MNYYQRICWNMTKAPLIMYWLTNRIKAIILGSINYILVFKTLF